MPVPAAGGGWSTRHQAPAQALPCRHVARGGGCCQHASGEAAIACATSLRFCRRHPSGPRRPAQEWGASPSARVECIAKKCPPVSPHPPHLRTAAVMAQPSSRLRVPPWRSHAHSDTEPAAAAAEAAGQAGLGGGRRGGMVQGQHAGLPSRRGHENRREGLLRAGSAPPAGQARPNLLGCTWGPAAGRRLPSRRQWSRQALVPAWRAGPV